MPAPALYLDECVDQRLAAALRALGFDVVTVQEAHRESEEDEDQLLYATAQGRMLLSHNQLDFRRWHAAFARAGRPHGGIILIPTRYVSLMSLLGTVVTAIIILALAMTNRVPDSYAVYAAIAAALIIWQHRANITRLRAGTEPKLSAGALRPRRDPRGGS